MRFQVKTAITLSELEEQVNRALDANWELHGGIFTLQLGLTPLESKAYICQAVVLPREAKSE